MTVSPTLARVVRRREPAVMRPPPAGPVFLSEPVDSARIRREPNPVAQPRRLRRRFDFDPLSLLGLDEKERHRSYVAALDDRPRQTAGIGGEAYPLRPHHDRLPVHPAATEGASRGAAEHVGPPHERRRKQRRRTLVEVLGAAQLVQVPAVQHRDAVGEGERLFLLVGYEYGGDAEAFDQRPQLAARTLPQRRIEVREGLVEQQHAGLGRERTGQRDPLLLPSGQLLDFALFEPRQVNKRQHLRDFLSDPSPVPLPSSLQAERDILPHVEMRKQGIVLKHHPEAATRRRERRHDLPLDRDAAGVGRLETGEQPQQRGLAAPRRSEERQNFPAIDV